MDAHNAPHFETANVASAAGVPHGLLNTWLDRHLVEPTLPAPGSGYSHRFSRNRSVQATIAFRLWDTGIAPRDAADAAKVFDGRLFPHGRTLLVIHGADLAKIVNVPDGSWFEPNDDQAAVVIDLNRLTASVDSKLKRKPWGKPTIIDDLPALEHELARMEAHLAR